MILFGIFFVIISVFIFLLLRNEANSKVELYSTSSVFGILVGLLFTIVTGVICSVCFSTESFTEEKSIVSLKGQNGINGSFCLGTGILNSTTYYVSYIKLDDGGYQQIKINSDMCRIYEDNDINPKLIYIKIKYKKGWWVDFVDFFGIIKNKEWTSSYELHVPYNTIYKSFSVE